MLSTALIVKRRFRGPGVREALIEGFPGSQASASGSLSEFRVVFSSNLADLFSCELLWGCAGWGAGVAEEAVESGGGDGPEHEEFCVGVGETVPGVFEDEEG